MSPSARARLVAASFLAALACARSVPAAETGPALPAVFVPNAGQTHPDVAFHAHTLGGSAFFTKAEVVLLLPTASTAAPDDPTRDPARELSLAPAARGAAVVRVRFVGADAVLAPVGETRLPGTASFFRGPDPSRWRTGLPTYASLVYADLYPGVDLRFEAGKRELKGTYHLAPRADPGRIRWRYQGVAASRIDASGALVLDVALPDTSRGKAARRGRLVEQPPLAWQEGADGGRHFVRTRYRRHRDGSVGFAVGAHDPSRPLVIDPSLTYSTFLGGGGEDVGYGVAVDGQGALYVTGYTASSDFPTQGGADGTCGADGFCDAGQADAFVTKLNPAAVGPAQLVYSTYLGGASIDRGLAIQVDGSGSAYLAGHARGGFPTTQTAFQTTFASTDPLAADAFLTKLAPSGAQLLYSTFLGGTGGDGAWSLAIDGAGTAWIGGMTYSSDFPVSAGALDATCGTDGACNGISDAFLARFDTNASGAASRVFATYLGGSAFDAIYGLARDGSGRLLAVGETESADFPTASAYQAALAGLSDGFVARLDAAATAIGWSTYLGGTSFDAGYGVAPAGAAVAVVGSTWSSDHPTTASAAQLAFGGLNDAYVARLDPSLAGPAQLTYATYLGGEDDDQGFGIAVDATGAIEAAGFARSVQFPVAGAAFQPTNGGFWDGFITRVDPAASGPASLVWSTFLGGVSTDSVFGLARAGTRLAAVGQSYSYQDHPLVGPFQSTLGGGSDVTVARLDDSSAVADVSVGAPPLPDRVVLYEDVASTLTVHNDGPSAASGVRLSASLEGASASFQSATASVGTCPVSAGTEIACTLGALPGAGTATVEVVLRAYSEGTLTGTLRAASEIGDTDAADNRSTLTTLAMADWIFADGFNAGP
jgi:uncharacterized protein DUF11/beta-propeller repeat-containing protein